MVVMATGTTAVGLGGAPCTGQKKWSVGKALAETGGAMEVTLGAAVPGLAVLGAVLGLAALGVAVSGIVLGVITKVITSGVRS